jgi:hypothetical protein
MPAQKDFKRLVRARMRKTGESYTAARVQLLRKKARPAGTAPAAKPDYARLAGMTDAKLKEKTGCDWSRWVRALDHQGADKMTHGEIARLVNEKWKVPGWWSQTVTVGYERIKGLREIGQRLDGTYEASKSRTLPAPVSAVFRAFKDPDTRARWLGRSDVVVRTATPGKTIRLGWPDGTLVGVYFAGKGTGKTQVAIQHMKLTSKAQATELKTFWGERLTALEGALTG